VEISSVIVLNLQGYILVNNTAGYSAVTTEITTKLLNTRGHDMQFSYSSLCSTKNFAECNYVTPSAKFANFCLDFFRLFDFSMSSVT